MTQQGNETLLEREETVLKPPPMYKVILLNDDFTPMDFVIFILQEYFHKDTETATRIMLKVHHEGKGVCGIFLIRPGTLSMALMTSSRVL